MFPVYLTYSSDMARGWAAPQAITKLTTLSGGYSYGFHAYPDWNQSGKILTLSWTRYAPPGTYIITMANVTFA